MKHIDSSHLRAKINWPWWLAHMRKHNLSMSFIARDIGCAHESVRKAVKREREGREYVAPCKVDWESYEELLGQMPDAKLAPIVGISRQGVGAARRRRGIPSFVTSTRQKHLLAQKAHARVCLDPHDNEAEPCTLKTLN